VNIQDIREMYAYNRWANRQILDAAARVSREHLMQPNRFSWGSLHGTLVHLLDAEAGWRHLLQLGDMNFDVTPEGHPDLPSIEARWDSEITEMQAWLNTLTDDDMARIIRYEVEEGQRVRVLWHCLWHVINHGMQHRSECAVMLTDFGQSPGDLDFTVYLNGLNA
jgi:uncharacterized damage-inducible protein DinB